tara:strand:- start:2828 stop:3025 length:198 start_codon:yes stop_codon:yes gene_type:complete
VFLKGKAMKKGDLIKCIRGQLIKCEAGVFGLVLQAPTKEDQYWIQVLSESGTKIWWHKAYVETTK